MSEKGMFISFEGVDGSGKSTISKLVAASLINQGHKVTLTREPGGSDLAEKIREIIINNEMDPIPEALLFFAARHDHYHKKIKPLLDEGHIVITDRFIHSSFVYQGLQHDIFKEVSILDKEFIKGARPDLTLVIDVPVEVSMSRMQDRGKLDRFDSASKETLERIRENFKLFTAGNTRCKLIKNVGSLDTTVGEIMFHIRQLKEAQ